MVDSPLRREDATEVSSGQRTNSEDSTPDSLFPRIEQDWCALKTGLRAQNDMKKADFIKKNPFSIRIFLDYWQVGMY